MKRGRREDGQTHNKNQTSPRPPIATVSHTALTDSFHNLPSNPCRPCTPLNRLRTSSTALVRAAAPASEPATTTVAAAAAAAADEGEIDFGQRRLWRRKRRSTASAGRTTQRRKSGAKRMYGRSAVRNDSIRDDDDALPLLGVVVVRVSTYHDVGRRSAEADPVSLSLRRVGLCASRRCN